MAIQVFSQGHVSHTQHTPTVLCCHRMREEIHQTPLPQERGMGLVLPPIEVYQVQHLPIVKAYADKIGLVETINQLIPTEMAIDPGPLCWA